MSLSRRRRPPRGAARRALVVRRSLLGGAGLVVGVVGGWTAGLLRAPHRPDGLP